MAQSNDAERFGCPGRTDFVDKPGLPFNKLTDSAAIAKWKTRPAVTFDGFNEKLYGFSKIVFHRWRISLQPGIQDADPMDQTDIGDATNRLALAVSLIGGSGERWFELGQVPVAQNYPSDELLTIQPERKDDDQEQTQPDSSGSPATKQSPSDEMEKWISIRPATPEPALPLFVLSFEYHNTGANAAGTIGNELMLDLRGGSPQVTKAAQCIEWDGGGACTAPDTANAVYDNLSCKWEQSASDFHCTIVGAFGGDYAPRVAGKDFYLSSGKPARAGWEKDASPADLTAFALQLAKDYSQAETNSVMIRELGPVSLLGRYRDLLPDSEVFLFASPAAGPALSSHFSFVVIPDHGEPSIQTISKWVISGEESDEAAPRDGFTPISSGTPALAYAGLGERILEDEYHVRELQQRPGFHALQVVANSRAAAEPWANIQHGLGVHLIYWVGMEAVNGKVVAGAVRVASEGSTYGSCGQDLHDGSAISVRQSPGIAEAAVTVRPPDANAVADDTEKQNQCLWSGVLHWKSGSGFRVRKISQDCKRNIPELAIADDGTITRKPASKAEQTR